MKVAFIDECAYTRRHGGAQTCTLELNETLKDRGLCTKVFSFTQGMSNAFPDAIKYFPNIREIFVYPVAGRKFIPAIEKDFDLLHFASTTTTALYRPLRPSVITVHCLFSRQAEQFKKYLPAQYKMAFNRVSVALFKFLEAQAFRNVDAVIALRRETMRYIIEELKIDSRKVHYIPKGVDLQAFSPPEKNDLRRNMAIFVGRATIAKGFDTIIEAADRIHGEIIVVASTVSNYYRKAIAQRKNIRVLTEMKRQDLAALYRQARVLMLPSITENAPLVTLEAMACGTPIVATTEGAEDYVKDGEHGYIIPIRNYESLVERVNELLECPSKAEQMGWAARRRVLEDFPYDRYVSDILNLYNHLVSISCTQFITKDEI